MFSLIPRPLRRAENATIRRPKSRSTLGRIEELERKTLLAGFSLEPAVEMTFEGSRIQDGQRLHVEIDKSRQVDNELEFTVKNVGIFPLELGAVVVSDPLSVEEYLDNRLFTYASDTFTIHVDPDLNGDGHVTFGTNDPTVGEFDFSLSIDVVGPELSVLHDGQEVSGDTIDLGHITKNDTAPATTITIVNPGNAPLVIDDVTVSGAFSIIAGTETTLHPGESADFVVPFIDTTTLGDHRGQLTIVSNAGTDPLMFDLTAEVVDLVLTEEIRLSPLTNAQGLVIAADSPVGTFTVAGGEVFEKHVNGDVFLEGKAPLYNPYSHHWSSSQTKSLIFPDDLDLLVHGVHVTPGILLATRVRVVGATAGGDARVIHEELVLEDKKVQWRIPDDITRIDSISWSQPRHLQSWEHPIGAIGTFDVFNPGEPQFTRVSRVEAEPWKDLDPLGQTDDPDVAHDYYQYLEQKRAYWASQFPNIFIVQTSDVTVEFILGLYHPTLVDVVATVDREMEGYTWLSPGEQADQRSYLLNLRRGQRSDAKNEIKTNLVNWNHDIAIWLAEAARIIERDGAKTSNNLREFTGMWESDSDRRRLGISGVSQAYLRVTPENVMDEALKNWELLRSLNDTIDGLLSSGALLVPPQDDRGAADNDAPGSNDSPHLIADPEDSCRPDYTLFDQTLAFMHDEMIRNAQSSEVRAIQHLFRRAALYQSIGWSSESYEQVDQALVIWIDLVRSGGDWDHKPVLEQLLGLDHTKDYYFPIRDNYFGEYYYDIWSNIHYGYVGSAAGFSPELLQLGAALEGVFGGTSDNPDKLSIQIGIDLWNHYGLELTPEDLHQAILDNTPHYLNISGQTHIIPIDEDNCSILIS